MAEMDAESPRLMTAHAADLFNRLVAHAAEDCSAYVDHAFVRQLGDGSLPEVSFRYFLVQDYLFLIHFARAYALAVYKGQSLADMRAAFGGLKGILDVEMGLHIRFCSGGAFPLRAWNKLRKPRRRWPTRGMCSRRGCVADLPP